MPSGYGQRRSFATSDATCEDWYGLGDQRCPSSYAPTGNLLTDIELIKEQLAHYSFTVFTGGTTVQVKSGWWNHFTELLQVKQRELEAEIKKKNIGALMPLLV